DARRLASDFCGWTSPRPVFREEKIDLAAYEIRSLCNFLLNAPAGAIFECDGSTLDVTQIAKPLPKRAGASVRLGVEHADLGNASRLLRVTGYRCEREANRENDREPDPPHGHLTGMAGGSLARKSRAKAGNQGPPEPW